MAKKDRKEFGQNPFSALKGFSAPAAPAPQVPPVKPAPTAAADEGPVDFAAAMAQIGVRRQSPEAPASEPKTAAEQHAPSLPVSPRSESEEFLQALAGMEPLFRDELPDEPVLATPRLTKLVRKGELAPEATLDLHGVTRETLREKLRWFFENSTYQGLRLLLIITGRGKSSGAEPVLRGEVERYLRFEAAAWVAEWDRAPGRLGGDGALVVLLKGKKP